MMLILYTKCFIIIIINTITITITTLVLNHHVHYVTPNLTSWPTNDPCMVVVRGLSHCTKTADKTYPAASKPSVTRNLLATGLQPTCDTNIQERKACVVTINRATLSNRNQLHLCHIYCELRKRTYATDVCIGNVHSTYACMCGYVCMYALYMVFVNRRLSHRKRGHRSLTLNKFHIYRLQKPNQSKHNLTLHPVVLITTQKNSIQHGQTGRGFNHNPFDRIPCLNNEMIWCNTDLVIIKNLISYELFSYTNLLLLWNEIKLIYGRKFGTWNIV